MSETPEPTVTAAIVQGREVLKANPHVADAIRAMQSALETLSHEERARARRYIVTVYLTPYGV